MMVTDDRKPPGRQQRQVASVKEAAASHRDSDLARRAELLSELIEGGELKEDILTRIREGGDFPIAPVTWTILTQLKTPAQTSVSDLASIILRDYGLTSKVLKLVNSVHYMRFGEVTTISRAILLLGLENIKNMAVAMALFERMQKKQSLLLTGLLTKAIYAALIGQALSARMSYPNPEEAFLGSLFTFLGEILIAYYAPGRYGEIRSVTDRETDQGPGSVSHRASWFYRDIGLAVAQTWGLPGKVVVCLRPVERAEVSSKMDVDRLHCICTIAASVAEISEREPSEEGRKRRIEAYLEYYGHNYQSAAMGIEEIRAASAGDVEKYCSVYGIDFRETAIGEAISTEPAQENQTSSEEMIEELESDFLTTMEGESRRIEDSESPDIIFANGMRDIARALLDDYQLDDIFTIIMETVYRGLRKAGISRTLLLIRNTKKPIMDVRLALGDSTTALRKWFIVPVDQKEEDLFNIALHRRKDLLVKDTSATATRRIVPGWLADSLKAPSFIMVLPITVKERSIGMIYVEGRREVLAAVEPSHLHYLKVLHDQAVLAIRKKSGV